MIENSLKWRSNILNETSFFSFRKKSDTVLITWLSRYFFLSLFCFLKIWKLKIWRAWFDRPNRLAANRKLIAQDVRCHNLGCYQAKIWVEKNELSFVNKNNYMSYVCLFIYSWNDDVHKSRALNEPSVLVLERVFVCVCVSALSVIVVWFQNDG